MKIFTMAIEATEATASVKAGFSPSIARNSLDFPNLYYHAIDMLKFSQYLSKKYTLVYTPAVYSLHQDDDY